jgi:hypothetical protein
VPLRQRKEVQEVLRGVTVLISNRDLKDCIYMGEYLDTTEAQVEGPNETQ